MLPRMSSISEIRDQWFPPPGAAAPPHAAKHRVVADVRVIIDQLVGADVTAVALDDLAAVEEAAGHLRRLVEALPDRRRQGSLARASLPEGALVERSPVSGRGNALAIPLTYTFDGEITRASGTFSGAYEGPPGGVHGGCVAAAFDEILGVAQMVTGVAGFTGTLKVRYHELTPVNRRIDFEAGPGDRDGRKLTMWARATADGVLVAQAEGLFVAQVAMEDDTVNAWTRD